MRTNSGRLSKCYVVMVMPKPVSIPDFSVRNLGKVVFFLQILFECTVVCQSKLPCFEKLTSHAQPLQFSS